MQYFIGRPDDLGTVFDSARGSFEELCEQHLNKPICLPYTREEFFSLPEKNQNLAKQVPFIVPCTFATSPSKRVTGLAERCNLLALDIDDSVEAGRLIVQGFAGLGDLGFFIHHTARSTPTKPRIRIIVNCDGIHPSRYAESVRSIAEMIGIEAPTRESLIPVQPMFLPTTFKKCVSSPVIAIHSTGVAFTASEIVEPIDRVEEGMTDLVFFSATVEDITPEIGRKALATLDPDCSMHEWIQIAAALKHQFGEDGYALWDEWSAKGKKYVDQTETENRWKSLKRQPVDRHPTTFRYILKQAKARGWVDEPLANKAREETQNWLRSPIRSTEELLDQGVIRIAKAGAIVSQLERTSLIITLRDVLSERDSIVPLPNLRKAVMKLEQEVAATTGTPPWAKSLCFITSTNTFYDYHRDQKFSPEVMDLIRTGPQIGDEKPMRVRDYLVSLVKIPQVEATRYDPAHKAKRIFHAEDKLFVNSYLPNFPKPDFDRAAEAGEIFLNHINNLIREPAYRKTLLDFLAYQVQHPGKKIRWATLIQGAQGCGKTLIASAMASVLGRRNVRKLSAGNVLEGVHNDWAAGSQLVVLEEVRIVGHNRYGVMDQLKPCLSDDEISLREMHEPVRTVPNITNYLMFTNHHDSLAIQDDDRRYFVLTSPLQRREQIAALGGEAYFNRIFDMIRDNAAGLRAWFENWEISKKFNPDGRAPATTYLKTLSENAASPLTAACVQVIADELHPLVRKDLLSLQSLRQLLESYQLPPFNDQILSSTLRELGWIRDGRYRVGDERHTLWTREPIVGITEIASERLKYL